MAHATDMPEPDPADQPPSDLHWIDRAALDGALSYVRTCEAGGMPPDTARAIIRAVSDMAELQYFSVNVAKAIPAAGYVIVPKEPTGAMDEADCYAVRDDEHSASNVYRAMIAAARKID